MSFEDPSFGGGSFEEEDRYYGGDFGEEEGFEGGEDFGDGSDGEIGGYEDEKSDGGEEDIGGGSGGGSDNEQDFKSTYADFERTAGGAIGTGVSKIQKSKRTAQDAAQDKAKGILNDGTYDWIEADEKQKVYNKMNKIENIERYNIETLVPAIIFVHKGYSLDKNFKSFFKKLTDINEFDLIRYIRFLNKN
jgi:hypothetical protein